MALLLPLLVATTASARIGGLAPTYVRPSPTASRGTFDGKSYELGFHLTPLFGYESNYKVTAQQVAGSGLFALEGGADLRYHPTEKLRLRAVLEALLRLPFADTALTEFSVELRSSSTTASRATRPVPLQPRGRRAREDAADLPRRRADDPLDDDPLLLVPRPAARRALLAAGEGRRRRHRPYFRVKQVNFIDPPSGNDPDYRLYDVGLDVAGKLYYRDRFSARLKYDYAHRFFRNYMALPPTRQPPLTGTLLAMDRHLVGLLLRARVVGPSACSPATRCASIATTAATSTTSSMWRAAGRR